MESKKVNGHSITDKMYWVTRIAAVLLVFMMFMPMFNPGRITNKIGKTNVSLFTSAISFEGMVTRIKQYLPGSEDTPLLSYDAFDMVRYGSIVAVVGILALSAAAAMSLGNGKFKKLGNLFGIGGSVVTIGGAVMTLIAHSMFKNELDDVIASGKHLADVESLSSYWPYVYIGIGALVLILYVLALLMSPKVDKSEKFKMETKYKLFLVLAPFIILIIAFSYFPLIGWRYIFFDARAGEELTSANYVGFKYFVKVFGDPETRKDILSVLRNTLVMSGLGIATSWVPMLFAIMLNEVKSKWFKKGVQVLTTIPNFISWVMVYAIALAIFAGDGFINTIFGTSKDFLGNPDGIWFKMLVWGIWKSVGWSAIIYIAGISGIDPQLYEAATVDGAGRTQKMWHVTLPGLLPTYVVLLMMSIGGILSNGMDQYLVFENQNNTEKIMVLDLYVYKNMSSSMGRSTMISMLKSVISVVLLFTANGISKAIRGESIM